MTEAPISTYAKSLSSAEKTTGYLEILPGIAAIAKNRSEGYPSP